MKKLLSVSILSILLLSAKAQWKVGAGLNVGIPITNLEGSSMAVGGDLMVHYAASRQVAITGDVGYTALFAKNDGKTTSIIPLRAGLRVYPTESFFIGGKIGAGFLSGNGSTTTTAYSFGAGVNMDNRWEIGASYDAYSKEGTIGLLNFRLGIFF